MPLKTQPLYVFFDGAHVFVGFFFRIGVVKTQIAQAIVNIGQAEIKANGFGVADVQIAVGLGRETGDDAAVFAAVQIFVDDVADKMVIGKLVFVHHGFGGQSGE